MPKQMLSPEDQLMQWITAKWITKPIQIVSELGIADLLADGPLHFDALAEKTRTHAPTLYRLLRALASVGVFTETDDGVFGLTPLSQCLRSNAMGPLARMFLSDWHDKAWNELAHAVRTGKPGFNRAFGMSAFEWLAEHPEERAVYDQAQGLKAMGFAKAVGNLLDFSTVGSIGDIGGGRGDFLIHILTRHSHATGIIADLPEAAPSAKRRIAEARLTDRCRMIPYDLLTDAPPECDGYFLVNVLHDWEDAVCMRILKNIAGAMGADSRLWIIEHLIDPAPGFSVVKLLDIEVLIMGGGLERTAKAYDTLVALAGLRMMRIIPIGIGPVMMECKLAS